MTAALTRGRPDPGTARLHRRARRGGRERDLGHAQEIRRPARQHAGRRAADRLRRGHGGAAGAPRRLHRRVPRRARRARPRLRHVRPRRRGRAARAPGDRHEGPGAGRPDPRGDRGRRPDHARNTAACSGASTARACAPSSRRASSARSTRRCSRSRPPSTRATSSTPARSPRPRTGELLRIDGLPTRGQLDRTIPAPVRAAYDEALHCNGNGACFTWDPDEAMCPSYKATRDRRHSPKGRASLTREWLRQLAALGFDPAAEAASLRRRAGLADASRSGCATRGRAGAASRTSPTRSRTRWTAASPASPAPGSARSRSTCRPSGPSSSSSTTAAICGPARDYLVGSLETMLPAARQGAGAPTISWLDSPPGRAADAGDRAGAHADILAHLHAPRACGARDRGRDAASACRPVRRASGRAAWCWSRTRSRAGTRRTWCWPCWTSCRRSASGRSWRPFRPNGKPLHVHGFLGAFTRAAARNAAMLRALAGHRGGAGRRRYRP